MPSSALQRNSMSKTQKARTERKAYAIRFSVSDESTKKFIEEQAKKTGLSLAFVAQQLLVTAVNSNKNQLAAALESEEVKIKALKVKPSKFIYAETHWTSKEISTIQTLIDLFGEDSLIGNYRLLWQMLRKDYGYSEKPSTLTVLLAKLRRSGMLLRNHYDEERVLTLHHKIHDLVNQAKEAGL